MRPIKTFFLLTTLFFAACSDSYEQQYDNFYEFNKANQRNKGWFPDFISADAFDLKNDSYLDPLCAFGTFNYSNNYYYDSIFADPSAEKIDFDLFKEKVTTHNNHRPSWFIQADFTPNDNYSTIKINRFYITKDKGQKKIYFVLSN
jgi:hypothetical protein